MRFEAKIRLRRSVHGTDFNSGRDSLRCPNESEFEKRQAGDHARLWTEPVRSGGVEASHPTANSNRRWKASLHTSLAGSEANYFRSDFLYLISTHDAEELSELNSSTRSVTKPSGRFLVRIS